MIPSAMAVHRPQMTSSTSGPDASGHASCNGDDRQPIAAAARSPSGSTLPPFMNVDCVSL